MRIPAFLLLATATLATPAFPQDAQDSPAPAPAFSGFRVEGLLGWDHSRILDDDEGAPLYGIGIGYDYRTGRAILGIEAEASDSNNNGCLRDLINPGDRYCADTGRDLYVGVRAGILVGPNVLLFAKTGYVNTRFGSDYDPGAGGQLIANRFNADGLRAGGGMEFTVGRHAFVRAEGRYTDYRNEGSRGAIVGAFGFRF